MLIGRLTPAALIDRRATAASCSRSPTPTRCARSRPSPSAGPAVVALEREFAAHAARRRAHQPHQGRPVADRSARSASSRRTPIRCKVAEAQGRPRRTRRWQRRRRPLDQRGTRRAPRVTDRRAGRSAGRRQPAHARRSVDDRRAGAVADGPQAESARAHGAVRRARLGPLQRQRRVGVVRDPAEHDPRYRAGIEFIDADKAAVNAYLAPAQAAPQSRRL